MSPTQDSLQSPPAPPPLALTLVQPPKPAVVPDLSLYADHLAELFEFEASAARLAEVAWYRERVGVEVCSLMQASELRELTVAACEDFVATVRVMSLIENQDRDRRLMEGTLAEVGRPGVKDDAEHRARRARFFAKLPRHVVTRVVAEAVDTEFEERTRWWAERDDVPVRYLDDDPLIEPEDLGEVWGLTATGVFLLAVLGAGLWALARWVVRR